MLLVKTFIVLNWQHFAIPVAIVLVCALLYFLWIRGYFPADATGNGITIGQAKAFDNRSLTLRLERLNARLQSIEVVGQAFTEALANVQEQTTSETNRSISAGLKLDISKGDAGKSTPNQSVDPKPAGDSASGEGAYKPNMGMAAGDILTDQLNLNSQISNLQMLNERSLTDRLYNQGSRVQTVLGFQISITPPAGYENCVAVAEVSVRARSAQGPPAPVSLVALMPLEKTYNVASISRKEQSIEGSAVAKVGTVGIGRRDKSRDLFLHRDSDTIAFERNPESGRILFETEATTFGWEFRPVLGRPTVSAGTRQMLAVISIPKVETEEADNVTLEIRTRSYWRRYNRKKQTTAPKISWLPWRPDCSATIQFANQELEIPNIARVQSDLSPEVTKVKWVNTGRGLATVIVTGRNFFTGTKVVISGKVYREEDKTFPLTLKSDLALEFETSIESLATGDAVLSGRFGPSSQLVIPKACLPVLGFEASRAAISPARGTKNVLLSIDIKACPDEKGKPKDLTVKDLENLPDPILVIGNELIAMPYDYTDRQDPLPPKPPTAQPEQAPAAAKPPLPGTANVTSTQQEQRPAAPSPAAKPQRLDAAASKFVQPEQTPATLPPTEKGPKYVRVSAWVSPEMLAQNNSVSFRVPFCGLDYQSTQQLNFSEPKLVRMGGDLMFTVFHIRYPLGFDGPVSVKLDQNYYEREKTRGSGGSSVVDSGSGSALLGQLVQDIERIDRTEFRMQVLTSVVSRYQYMVLLHPWPRPGAEPAPNLFSWLFSWATPKPSIYLLPIPPEFEPVTKPVIDKSGKPPQITLGARGPVEWSGESLDMIKTVALSGVAQDFGTYDDGKRITVYLAEGSPPKAGKAEIEFQTHSGEVLHADLFVTER